MREETEYDPGRLSSKCRTGCKLGRIIGVKSVAQPATNPKIVQFGLFELDLDARELRKSGVRIKLQEQPFQILAMLLERPGEIVSREELQKRLWPEDTFVDFDLSLNSAVKKLRQALNDDSENPRFIETLYRRGYRFIGPVNGVGNSNGNQIAMVESPQAGQSQPLMIHEAPALSTLAKKHPVLYTAFALLLIIGVLVVYRVIPSERPRVLGFSQITHDGLLKFGMVSDGERLYIVELQGDRFVINQLSVAGGETSTLLASFPNVLISGITPNGSALVVNSFQGTGKGTETWFFPLPSGPPRRLGDLRAEFVAWSSDGNGLVFSRGQEIYTAKSDLTDERKLVTAAGDVARLSFSPHARRIRFDMHDPGNTSMSLWEMASDGSGLHPVLPGWNSVPRECCGAWTPDGKYYLFQSRQDGRDSIWALPEKSNWLTRTPKPVQLTNGPLNFQSPLPSKDGKRIFVIGSQPRCELVRSDGKSAFIPYLGGRSISDLIFSSDGKWVAYVSVPESQLWRSRIDGSERLQLSPDGMSAGLPRWSPDGKQLVFMGATDKTEWRVYVVANDGTGLRELMPGAKSGYDPGWSPDGKSIVFTPSGGGDPKLHREHPGIAVYDLRTGQTSTLPGSTQFFSPRWSPDGRYIAAITNDSLKLVVFDRNTQQWSDLAGLPIGYPSWSHDGQYIYFDTTLNEDPAFYRVRISDRKLERLASIKGLQRYWGQFGPWTGLAPDDSFLLVRDISNQEVYALDWQAP
jgi:Tol biopolymer transport system component/DNA-binding winged helix-turn-helix (wHTH) protein